MKKSLKKTIALSLCAALCAGISACGGGGGTGGASDTTTVTVWSGNGHDKEFLNERINNWNQTTGKEKKIRIDYIVQEGSMDEKLTLAFETGKAPDLFTGGDINKLAESGQLMAYDDLAGIDKIMERYSKYTMYKRTKSATDDKIYSLPKTVTTSGLIYNKDMFKAAGLVDENGEATPPETLEELREYAKILTNADKKQFGIIFPAKYPGWYGDDVGAISAASSGFNDGYDPKTGKYDFSYIAKVMETLVGIKADGSYYPGAESLDNDPARAKFAAGDIGMKTAASYDYGVLTTQFPATIDWGVAPMPVADKNDKRMQPMGAYAYMLINKTAGEEKPEAIAEVLNFFYGDELVIDAYKEGIDLPLDWDLVKDVEVGEEMKQWKEFASLVAISNQTPFPLNLKLDNEPNLPTIWLNEIWPGNVPADKIAERMEQAETIFNEKAKEYQEMNPDYNPNLFIIPDWDATRK